MKKTVSILLFTGVCMASGSISAALPKTYIPQIILDPPSSSEEETVTDLYVWRHGETDSNVAEILSGGGDIDATLTDTGRKQAIALAQKISRNKIPLQAIYSSDLPRAQDTAKAVEGSCFSQNTQSIIPAPQLREILHRKYERIPADLRTEKVASLFANELKIIGSTHKSITQSIENGSLDRFHFWKIHPMNGNKVEDDAPIQDVKDCSQNAETVYELFRRAHAELIRIAKENHEGGAVGVSTHGAFIGSLINAAEFGDKHVFVPLFYQSKAIENNGEVVMPMPIKIGNCALTHFRYWHKSQQLQFCGMIE